MRPLATVLLSALLLPHLGFAATIRVPADQPTIQAGIDAGSAGDTVLVACGTYYEHDIVLKSGVCLRSETGLADCVTVDGQWLGGSILSGLDLGSTTMIEGLTVEHGQPAGIDLTRSSPIIAQCSFQHNEHGVACDEGSSPLVTGCAFMDNSAYFGGGGLICDSSSPTLEECAFAANFAAEVGGGAVYCAGSTAIFRRCEFWLNVSDWAGGAVCGDLSTMTFTDCAFESNQAWHGGAVYLGMSSGILERCVFWHNAAGGDGGAAYLSDSDPAFRNCTLWDNGANGEGGCLYVSGASPAVQNSILGHTYRGDAVVCAGSASPPAFSCSDVFGNMEGDWVGCISGQEGMNGNFSADPRFCSELTGQLHLDCLSPCAPAQQPECGLIGALDVGCGASASQPSTWGLIKQLFKMPGR